MNRETIQHIQCLEEQISKALLGRDAQFVEQLWDDDFAYTGPRGELKNKAELVRELKSGEQDLQLLRFDDVKVRVHGPTAVVTGLATTKGRSPAGPILNKFRYTRVYQHKNGAWKLTAFQGTPLAA